MHATALFSTSYYWAWFPSCSCIWFVAWQRVQISVGQKMWQDAFAVFLVVTMSIERRTLLIIGATGAGKSTLCNVLYNKDGQLIASPFTVNDTTCGVTTIHKIMDNNELRIIDTIGLGESRVCPSTVVQDISNALECLKHGIDACLFVIRCGRY